MMKSLSWCVSRDPRLAVSGAKAEVAQRAEVRYCPCCAMATHVALSPTNVAGEFPNEKKRGAGEFGGAGGSSACRVFILANARLAIEIVELDGSVSHFGRSAPFREIEFGLAREYASSAAAPSFFGTTGRYPAGPARTILSRINNRAIAPAYSCNCSAGNSESTWSSQELETGRERA